MPGKIFWLPGMAFESITHTFFDIEIERLNSPEEVHLVKILSIDGRDLTVRDNYWQYFTIAAGNKFHFLLNDKPSKNGA